MDNFEWRECDVLDLPLCVSPQPRRPPVYIHASVNVFTRSRHSFPFQSPSRSFLLNCDPYHEARSPDDDVTPNCHLSALRFSFHRPTKWNSQLDISWPPIAGYSHQGRINIRYSLFNLSTDCLCIALKSSFAR